MLVMPNGPFFYRICAIDPGTDTLGAAVLDVDLSRGVVFLREAVTVYASRNVRYFENTQMVHGDRWARLEAHKSYLKSWFAVFNPNCIICESPFLGRFPQAFEALVECRSMIQTCVLEHNPWMSLETIDPPSAKRAVGTVMPPREPGRRKRGQKSKGGDKALVRDAIMKLPNLVNETGIPYMSMSEHATDAIAVGYFKARQILNFIGCQDA